MTYKKNYTYYDNGNVSREYWYIYNGSYEPTIYHRVDGPAITNYFESGDIGEEIWIVDGKYHRTDGPAYIHYQRSGDICYVNWYVNGKEIDISPYLHLFKPDTWEFKDKESEVIFKLSIV